MARRWLELVWNPAAARVLGRMLERRNRTCGSPIIGDEKVVVSLTTYGARFKTVHLAIESIARGSRKPAKILLWIDDEELLQNLTPGLRRLIERGLEIRPCPNYGPHKKYYPAVAGNVLRSGQLIAVCDDDTIYPRRWLEMLLVGAAASPGQIICHRAHTMSVQGEAIVPYSSWGGVLDNPAFTLSFRNGCLGGAVSHAYGRPAA